MRWGKNGRPNDDNDGVVDDADCAPFDASVQTCAPAPRAPEQSGSGQSSPGDDAPVAGADSPGHAPAGSAPALLVTSLPSTGSGFGDKATSALAGFALLASAMVLAAGMRTVLRRG